MLKFDELLADQDCAHPSDAAFTALTLSAQVSGGEFKGPASHSTRSSLEAQNGLPQFLAAFSMADY
jgi:hypothetical protein